MLWRRRLFVWFDQPRLADDIRIYFGWRREPLEPNRLSRKWTSRPLIFFKRGDLSIGRVTDVEELPLIRKTGINSPKMMRIFIPTVFTHIFSNYILSPHFFRFPLRNPLRIFRWKTILRDHYYHFFFIIYSKVAQCLVCLFGWNSNANGIHIYYCIFVP